MCVMDTSLLHHTNTVGQRTEKFLLIIYFFLSSKPLLVAQQADPLTQKSTSVQVIGLLKDEKKHEEIAHTIYGAKLKYGSVRIAKLVYNNGLSCPPFCI